MSSRKAVGAIVWCVSGTVVQGDVVKINTRAVADAETMHRVILNIDIVY